MGLHTCSCWIAPKLAQVQGRGPADGWTMLITQASGHTGAWDRAPVGIGTGVCVRIVRWATEDRCMSESDLKATKTSALSSPVQCPDGDACRHGGGAQVQSLTPTPPKHFGPLKGGGGMGGAGTKKNTPLFEALWCLGNIHTHAPRAATSQATHDKNNLADHQRMISTNVISHKPCIEQSGRDAVA